jgi:hypothetical protein
MVSGESCWVFFRTRRGVPVASVGEGDELAVEFSPWLTKRYWVVDGARSADVAGGENGVIS